jgi:hypothetical protein
MLMMLLWGRFVVTAWSDDPALRFFERFDIKYSIWVWRDRVNALIDG